MTQFNDTVDIFSAGSCNILLFLCKFCVSVKKKGVVTTIKSQYECILSVRSSAVEH